jgi:type I restriction enzyme R subunit
MDDYTTLSCIYSVVRNAYTKRVSVDRAFQKKTNELVQRHIDVYNPEAVPGLVEIDSSTIEIIKKRKGGDGTKVINLVKSIAKAAEEESHDPFLIAMADRARAVQESFEDRQKTTGEALSELLQEIEKNEQRKREQAKSGLDSLAYFVLCKLTEDGFPNPESVAKKVGKAFVQFPNWRDSEAELRQARQEVTFALLVVEEDMEKVAALVDTLLTLLQKSFQG